MADSDRPSGPNPDDFPTMFPLEEARTVGKLLANRYQIVDVLGIGGMGAVYKAFDRELGRIVALKTILPEYASTPIALTRLKQEVLLAQSIVHRNVIRIFDIGEDGATKFITMAFIEGRTLKTLIDERGKLAAFEAAAIIHEVCEGLEAAHAAGVVHRDLKPNNIMIGNDGHVVVMDFGIARGRQLQGATQIGVVLGTPEYMSPEQVQMEEVDARSDIFSVGLIFYELLTRTLPFRGTNLFDTMVKRTAERASQPTHVDPSIPQSVSNIVAKCLERAKEHRYQSVTELLNDLETLNLQTRVGPVARFTARLRHVRRSTVAVAVALVLVAVAARYLIQTSHVTPLSVTAHAPLTVLIADFSNHTGDPVFDSALGPVVRIALEEASFIAAYDRTAVRSVGVPAIPGELDEKAARQIAVGHGFNVVVTGSLERQGTGYALSMKAMQSVTGNIIRLVRETASDKSQVLFATTTLTAAIRKALGDDTSESSRRFAKETLTTTSLEAVQEYAAAREAMANGRFEDALTRFSRATAIDSNFGIAYGGQAVAAGALGQQDDAEKYTKLALAHLDGMTERERYRTRGSYYLLLGNQVKCVEEYGLLIAQFASDATAHNNRALCLSQLRQWNKALDEARQAAAIFPGNALYRNNISLYASYGTDFQLGEREARAVQQLNPSFHLGHVALAFAQLGQGRAADAVDTYRKLAMIGTLGASYSLSGLADVAIYEGRFNDALRFLEQGTAVDSDAKYVERRAMKLATMAYIRLLKDQKVHAVAAAEQALEISRTTAIRFQSARVFAAVGESARAKALAGELGAELSSEPQAYAKVIEAEIALADRHATDAIRILRTANDLLDTWIGHFALGRAYLEAGAATEADSEFDQCLKRRGEALSLFLNEMPTYGYLPPVYYYLGRVREALKSQGYADSYRTYLSIREKAGEDPLAADARKRIGS